MKWLTIIGAVLKVGLLIFQRWNTDSAEQKEKIKEAEDVFKEGIKKRDISKITIGYNRANLL